MTLTTIIRQLPATAYLYGVLAVAAVSGFAGFVHYQRVIGARDLALHQADSLAKVARHASDSAKAIAEQAAADADALRARARAELARERAAKVRADSVAAAASSERDRATRLLEDSSATVAQLRAQVERLVASGTADSAAAADRIAQLERSKFLLLQTVAADSTAIREGLRATNAAIARAVAAEHQVAILRRLMPSTVGGWVKLVAVGVAGVEAGRASAGHFP